MATLQSLITRTRMELADVKRPFYEVVASAGISRLDLQAENVETLYLYPKGAPGNVVPEAEYSLDPARGVVYFNTPPAYGSQFVVEGESSQLFSDAEFEVFVTSAFAKHTNNRMPAANYSNLPVVEEHLVAILAKIEALWVLLTSAAFDINIHAPEGMFIPRAQRYEQLRELLMMTEAQYKELSNALGVGLYTLEMTTLRRVSRLTGRYVPIYIDREIDDTRPPQRVFPPISAQGAKVPQNSIASHDLQIFQGRPFEETFTLRDDVDNDGIGDNNMDLTTWPDFTVTLYRSPYSVTTARTVLPEFTTVVDVPNSTVTVSLTAEQTEKLETTGSYVWDLKWLVDSEPNGMVLLAGDVLVESSYPYKNSNVQVS